MTCQESRLIIDSGFHHWVNINNQLHREDGPAVITPDGTKEWRIDGNLHREDGPAVEWADGSMEWWINGKLHRVDGPAIEWPDGSKFWWINDVEITDEVNKWRKEMGITNIYLTPEESSLFVLYFGNSQ